MSNIPQPHALFGIVDPVLVATVPPYALFSTTSIYRLCLSSYRLNPVTCVTSCRFLSSHVSLPRPVRTVASVTTIWAPLLRPGTEGESYGR